MNNKAVSPEALRPSYKNDKRRPICLRRHEKYTAVTEGFTALFCIYTVLGDLFHVKDKDDPLEIAVFLILMFGMFVSGFIWTMNLSAYKAEPHDEMSAQIKGRANGTAFFLWYALVMVSVFVLEMIKKGSVSQILTLGNFYMLSVGGLLIYDAIRRFVFLVMDRPDKPDDSEV
ncbi:hypothetical protein [Ruminococcus sp.]|uniref:hypothetical protein n=1 Tax=Ruminococcus sp. TaxID=41978 RepID=UPI0025DBA09B|nr:hypothetical protein [Ruminococcus sp.]MBQ9543418.1 hypothetical protein [Ruminococcus sp.]